MSVVIQLEDGRQIVVQASAGEVNRAIQAALRAKSSLEIDTPEGAMFINPRQIQSFAEAQPTAFAVGPDRVPEPA